MVCSGNEAEKMCLKARTVLTVTEKQVLPSATPPIPTPHTHTHAHLFLMYEVSRKCNADETFDDGGETWSEREWTA